ncbi:hypothetical protein Tco_0278303 [Tanacetum coccineum]
MISRHLQPRTCNDELLEPATWQAVIRQPPPHVSEWDRSDCHVSSMCRHVSATWHPRVSHVPPPDSYDSSVIPNGAALSAYQYFENVRNFLMAFMLNNAIMYGGKSSRIVNCVLALKSYNEWKQTGSNGTWKFRGNLKASIPNKQLISKNSDPFTNSVSRSIDNSRMVEDKIHVMVAKDKSSRKNFVNDEELRRKHLRYQMVYDDQQEHIKALRQTLLTTKAGMQFMQRKSHEEIYNLGQHVLGLAHDASRYHIFLEENIKLCNQVQDLKGD